MVTSYLRKVQGSASAPSPWQDITGERTVELHLRGLAVVQITLTHDAHFLEAATYRVIEPLHGSTSTLQTRPATLSAHCTYRCKFVQTARAPAYAPLNLDMAARVILSTA